jgi:endoribonuclease Dicer
MALTFPAIIHRVDSALVTLDACDLLGISLSPDLALEAMTKGSDNTDEHGKQQINFQAGMGRNYERLEFLGDCFLKMATTISIYTVQPKGDECHYHVERMILITNQTLFNNAVDCKLQEYIRSKSFDRRTWYPDLPLKKGKAPKTTVQHSLADKTIADVCEALIGASYLMGQEDSMDLAVRAVTRMVKSKNHKMEFFADYFASYNAPAWQIGDANRSQRNLAQKIADTTGYVFKHPPLVQSAFKHPSIQGGGTPNYQRLEFLGDSLLDMAIVDYLYRNFPQADPQWLSEHKQAMASNQFLGCLCIKLGLYKSLLIGNQFDRNISSYVFEMAVAEEEAREEAEAEGVPMRMDFWVKVTTPPKIYADSIEALVGAMFVDSEYDYTVVKTFFTRFIKPYFEDMSLYDTFANKHPVTFLYNKMQKELGCVNWRMSSEAVPCKAELGMYALKENDIVAVFIVHQKVITSHTSKSGRYGKMHAAKLALGVLKEFGNNFAAARKFLGCDCELGAEGLAEIDHGTAI